MVNSAGNNMICRWVFVMSLFVLATAARQANALTCAGAVTTLAPCQAYLTDKANSVTAVCCQAANSLNNMVKTKAELRDLCNCLKQVANALNVDVPRAKSIPQICKIKVPVPIDPKIDCSKI